MWTACSVMGQILCFPLPLGLISSENGSNGLVGAESCVSDSLVDIVFSTSPLGLGVGDSLLDGHCEWWHSSENQKGFCFAWICRFFCEESRQFGWAFGLSLHLVARMQKRPQICSFLVALANRWAFLLRVLSIRAEFLINIFGYGFKFGNEDAMRDNH